MQGLNPNDEERRCIELLYTLACALGPLRIEDLRAILSSSSEFLDPVLRSSILSRLSRFVVGDGDSTGISFSHPYLRDYYLGLVRETPTYAERQERFLIYCRKILQDLN